MYTYAVNMISKLNVCLHYSARVLLLGIFQILNFYTIYTALSVHEKQVMYFNQQHSALEVCFANIVYFEIAVI